MTSLRNAKSLIPNHLLPWLEVVAIAAWGVLILKYWLTDKLNLLIHPDFFWLVIVAAIGLLSMGFCKSLQLWHKIPTDQITSGEQHINVFPPGWSSSLLLAAAVLGFIISPQVFASQTALNREVTEILGATRTQPQAFRANIRPEERTLIDWVRILNVYPEPDAYTGQKVKVQGFVIHSEEINLNHLILARFVITCCAADVYPAGLPVQLPTTRDQYPPDTWLEVEGQMITSNIADKRRLTIKANSIRTIPQPKNPYSY